VPDLSPAQTPDDVLELVRRAYGDAPEARLRNFMSQLAAFALRMEQGDVVYADAG